MRFIDKLALIAASVAPYTVADSTEFPDHVRQMAALESSNITEDLFETSVKFGDISEALEENLTVKELLPGFFELH